MRKFRLTLFVVGLGILMMSSGAMAVSLQVNDPGGDLAKIRFEKDSSLAGYLFTYVGAPDGKGATSTGTGNFDFPNNFTFEPILKSKTETILSTGVTLSEYWSGYNNTGATITFANGVTGTLFVKEPDRGDTLGVASVATPEPASFLLLGGVMAVGAGVLRKKFKK
jgi:hypothetical protein